METSEHKFDSRLSVVEARIENIMDRQENLERHILEELHRQNEKLDAFTEKFAAIQIWRRALLVISGGIVGSVLGVLFAGAGCG